MCAGCAAMRSALAAQGKSSSSAGFDAGWLTAAARPGVRAVVLGSAAWWSRKQGLADPLAAYATMLAWVEPALSRLALAGTRVVWTGAPPMLAEQLPTAGAQRYAWPLFARYDDLASAMIGRVPGAAFLNVSEVTWQRKRDDGNASSDGLQCVLPCLSLVTRSICLSI